MNRILPTEADAFAPTSEASNSSTHQGTNGSKPPAEAAHPQPIHSAQIIPPALDLIAHAKALAKAEGNNLQNVDGLARSDARAKQEGKQAAIHAGIIATDQAIGENQLALKIARKTMSCVPKVMAVIIMTIGLLLGLGVEQFSAATILKNTGAFNVITLGQGLLLTATPIAVGFALKLAYGVFSNRTRRIAFGCACIALVGAFFTYAVPYAIEAGAATRQNQVNTEARAGTEGVGDGGVPAPLSDGTSQEPPPPSKAWIMFLALIGMMVLTTAIGGVGIENRLEQIEAWKRTPEYRREANNEKFHQNEISRLREKRGSLEQKLEQFTAEEEAAVATALATYIAERDQVHRVQTASN